MKLAKIILPLNDNAGTPMPIQHADLRHELLTRFGGYTETQGMGGWLTTNAGLTETQREPVCIYDVAMHESDTAALWSIARKTAGAARQKCVMIVEPCGKVEFVEPENKSADPA